MSDAAPAEPPPPGGRVAQGRAWLEAHRRPTLLAVIAAAAIVRALYFAQGADSAIARAHHAQESDMAFFDAWARRIAAGDVIGREPLHPLHAWHRTIAEEHLAAHPEEIAQLVQQGILAPDERARAVWNRWYGGTLFHQEPLYAYFVALMYWLSGGSVLLVFAMQLLAGVGTVVVMFLLVRRRLGDLEAVVTAALLILCGPLLAYEMVLLRTSLMAFAGACLLALTDRALETGTSRRWLVAGLAFGAAMLLQSTFLLFAVAVVGLLAVRHRSELAAWLRPAALLAGGIGLALVPAVARNLEVGAPALGLSSVGATTFINSNVGGYRPTLGFQYDKQHAPRILASTGGRLMPSALETLGTHASPASYLGQVAVKFHLAWNAFEMPNNVNLRLHAGLAWILKLAFVTFAMLSPLALVGFVIARGRSQALTLCALLALTTLVTMLGFYVLSRFRAPLAVALAPFAAVTLVEAATWISTRAWRELATAGAAVVALAIWTSWPMPEDRPAASAEDYGVLLHGAVFPEATEAIEGGRSERACAVLQEALRLEPDAVKALGPGRKPGSKWENDVGFLFGNVRYLYARALERTGRRAESERENMRYLEILSVCEMPTSGTP